MRTKLTLTHSLSLLNHIRRPIFFASPTPPSPHFTAPCSHAPDASRPSIATAAIDAGRRALRRVGPGGARPPVTHHGGPRRPPPLRPQRHPLPHRAVAAVKSVHAFDRAMLDSMRSPWAERRRVEVSCISAADTKPENLVGLRLHSDEPCAWWCRRWMQLVKCVWPWIWSPPLPHIGSGSRLGATAAGIALVPWFVLSLPRPYQK